MEENKMAWAVMQQEKNVLVTQVKCLYKVRNDLWEVVDLYRTLIFPDQIKKPQYRVKDSLLFKTQNEAIVAAEKLAPKNHNNKGGHNN